MISMQDIRKRQTYLNMKNVLKEYSVDLLLENCKKTNSVNIIETYFKNWPYGVNENYYEFIEAVNILESFIKRTKINSDKTKAINVFSEMVIPKVINIKSAKNVLKAIKEFDSNELIQECNKYIVCDRILNNHNKLVSKGINNLLEDTLLNNPENLDDYITEVCKFIDNINMEFPIKYNVALENTLYLLDKQGIRYNRKNILESINDYFFVNVSKENINKMNIILKENELYSDDDINIYQDLLDDDEDLSVIQDSKGKNISEALQDNITKVKDKTKETAHDILMQIKTLPDKTPESLKQFIKKFYTKSPESIVEETPNFLIWMRKFIIFSTIAISPYLAIVAFFADLAIQTKLQRSDINKIIGSFKSEKEKCENKLAKSDNEKQKARLQDYIKELDKNIRKLEDYEDTLYSEKENEKRYDDKMNESVEFEFENHITLKEYIDIWHPKVVSQMYLLRDKLEKYLKSKYSKLYESQCIILLDIAELKKFENTNINSVLEYISLGDNKVCIDIAKFLGIRYKELNDTVVDQKDILSDICDNLQLDIDYDFCLLYEGEEDMYTIYLSFNKPIILDDGTDNPVEEQVHNSILKSCATIAVLDEAVSKVAEKDMDYLLSFIDDHIDTIDMATVDCVGQFSVAASDIINPKVLLDLFEEKADIIRHDRKDKNKYKKLTKIQEGINAIKNATPRNGKYLSVYDAYEDITLLGESIDLVQQLTINETSLVNVMKMAQQKLRNNTKKLSDKEKQLSRQLDFAVDTMVQKMRNTVTNNNREAVIKGSIIPSASKILKIAIGSAALFAVNPAIAVIGVLGGLGASKAATMKERQYILDEIDVQMKVVDKKIQLADRSDDMKSMEELLKIQQKLKREKARIEYHKKDFVPARKDD